MKKLVVRCQAHPSYTGLGSPVRVGGPKRERCEGCVAVQVNRRATFGARGLIPDPARPDDPDARDSASFVVAWGVW